MSHLPESFQREQGRLVRAGIRLGRAGIISQTGGDGTVVAIGQTDNEVRIRATTDANDFHALAEQGMRGMGDRHPIRRWLGKGGSVL